MVSQATRRAQTGEKVLERSATYFGLVVEVIDPMPNYTLVRYRDREFAVYTEDLVSGTHEEICDVVS